MIPVAIVPEPTTPTFVMARAPSATAASVASGVASSGTTTGEPGRS